MKAFRALLISELKIFSRDRMGMFFTLLFPLIYILIFGFLMGDIGDVDQATLGILISEQTDDTLLRQTIDNTG